MGDFLTSAAFQQSFWLFLGVVAGSLIQFLFHYIISRSQRGKAKKLFLVEIEINAEVLKATEAELMRKKSRFVSGQQNEYDFNFDFSDFNYRMVDPLINSGHFHAIVGAAGVKSYFTFINDLNVQSQLVYKNLLMREHEQNKSVRFLDYMIDTKLKEWRDTLDLLRQIAGSKR